MKGVIAVLLAVLLVFVPIVTLAEAKSTVLYPYTSAGPQSQWSQQLVYEDFDTLETPEEGGFFSNYSNDSITSGDYAGNYIIPQVSLELSDIHAKSGKSLHVYNRTQLFDSVLGEHSFLLTDTFPKTQLTDLTSSTFVVADELEQKTSQHCPLYSVEYGTNVSTRDFRSKIIENFGNNDAGTADTYYFQAWVYSDTPQTFVPVFRYGHTGEVWVPLGKGWEVPEKTWTLVGGEVYDGVSYYGALLGEGDTPYGIFPPSKDTSSIDLWFTTKYTTFVKARKASQKQDAEGYRLDEEGNRITKVAFTSGDYYVDDLAIWKVTNPSKTFYYDDVSKKMVAASLEEITLGDANDDGFVDMKDVLLIRKYLAGLARTIDVEAADVIQDHSVDMKDVLRLRKDILINELK